LQTLRFRRAWSAEVAEDRIVHDIIIARTAPAVKGGNRPERYG
jgi:hypothetical protein